MTEGLVLTLMSAAAGLGIAYLILARVRPPGELEVASRTGCAATPDHVEHGALEHELVSVR